MQPHCGIYFLQLILQFYSKKIQATIMYKKNSRMKNKNKFICQCLLSNHSLPILSQHLPTTKLQTNTQTQHNFLTPKKIPLRNILTPHPKDKQLKIH